MSSLEDAMKASLDAKRAMKTLSMGMAYGMSHRNLVRSLGTMAKDTTPTFTPSYFGLPFLDMKNADHIVLGREGNIREFMRLVDRVNEELRRTTESPTMFGIPPRLTLEVKKFSVIVRTNGIGILQADKIYDRIVKEEKDLEVFDSLGD